MTGAKDQQARRLNIDDHAGNEILDQLETPDGASKLLALFRIAHRRLDAPLADPDAARRHTIAAIVQRGHRDFESPVNWTKDLIFGNAAILEDEFPSIGSTQTELAVHVAR